MSKIVKGGCRTGKSYEPRGTLDQIIDETVKLGATRIVLKPEAFDKILPGMREYRYGDWDSPQCIVQRGE